MQGAPDLLSPVACGVETSSLLNLGVELFCILVFSHLFNVILKPIVQPGPISQILAGIVLGPSGLSQIRYVKQHVFQDSAKTNYNTMVTFCRILFMFLIGLEIDIPYILRNFRVASSVACSGAIMCSILAAMVSPMLYQQTNAHGSGFKFSMIIMMLLANTASPVVIRMAAELKLDSSEVGRLAISSSLINDISTLLGLTLISTSSNGVLKIGSRIWGGLICLLLLAAAILLNRHLVWRLNKRNQNRKHLRNIEVVLIVILVAGVAMYTELLAYNSIISCFLLGVMFPREGKTYRTLLDKLTYPVHNFILPIYFGYTGLEMDLMDVGSFHGVFIIIVVVVLSIGGKIIGTLVACRYFKIPLIDGFILALLLNVKGHVDLLLISLATEKHRWNHRIYNVWVITVAINTVIVGPAMAFIVRRERRAMAFRYIGLEWQNPENELRVLACVHDPRHAPTMVGLIGASAGTKQLPITAYMMHLVEFTEQTGANLLYHQQDQDLSDEEDYGGNDTFEINEVIDAFVAEMGVPIRQITAVSPLTKMHEDLCKDAEDLRASILLLPFHKHQRIDGKMENSKEGIRTTNQKVLRNAPCSVGILVDRGLSGATQVSESTKQQVATLFFGGADDREALAYSSRIAMHPNVRVTIFRFRPMKQECDAEINIESINREEVLMAITTNETEDDEDEIFVSDFCNRYVTSGQVEYVEKYVEDGAETMTALTAMGGTFSLFIVGRGGQGLSPLTTEMCDWEECPELGAVGDLLASSDFAITGSVLVIRQHRPPNKECIDHEFAEL